MLSKLSNRLTEERSNSRSVGIFCKAITLFTFIKMILCWSISSLIMPYQPHEVLNTWLLKIVFSPTIFATHHVHVFYSVSLVFLAVTFFVRWTYFTSIPFFWFCLNFWRISAPMGNGSDLVLMVLSFWMIMLTPSQIEKDSNDKIGSHLFFNLIVLMCQLQVVIIYFVSGWDKLMNEIWRSGDALIYISRIDFVIHPALYGMPDSVMLRMILAWMAIAFELSFVVLVWFSRTRLIVLAAGIIFHLVIWIALSLPDFSLLMIVSYLIFMKDADYTRLGLRSLLRNDA